LVTEVIFPRSIELNKLQLVMNRHPTAAFLVLFAVLSCVPSVAQEDQYEGTRKIINKVTPQYPDMARSIQLRGTVKAEALVEANGVVKSVELKGGNRSWGAQRRMRSINGSGHQPRTRLASPSK